MFEGPENEPKIRLRDIDWRAIFGSALVLAFCLLVLVPATGGNQNPGHYSAADQYDKEQAKVVAPERADDRVATYTLWLTVFTALLVLVSAVQGYLILRAEKLTRQSLRVSILQAVRAKNAADKQSKETYQALTPAGTQAKAALEQARAANEAN